MTVLESAEQLRSRLKVVGLSARAIKAAWPRWWTAEADRSLSARVDLRFSVARHLGLDPRSLLDPGQSPRFIWAGDARFKHLSHEGEMELAVLASFGRAVGSILLQALKADAVPARLPASELRSVLLGEDRPFIQLVDLLSLCWSLGIPVIHLRVFPWPQKRMAAMTVRVEERTAILLAQDSQYPAQTAFYLAHELGHTMLGHLAERSVIVDLEEKMLETAAGDLEENLADAYGLELLTGDPKLTVRPASSASSARELARVVLAAGPELQIEPGTLALCFGYSTQRWRTTFAAMRLIYTLPKPVWVEVNHLARRELDFSRLPDDAGAYLDAILGSPEK